MDTSQLHQCCGFTDVFLLCIQRASCAFQPDVTLSKDQIIPLLGKSLISFCQPSQTYMNFYHGHKLWIQMVSGVSQPSQALENLESDSLAHVMLNYACTKIMLKFNRFYKKAVLICLIFISSLLHKPYLLLNLSPRG